MGKSIFFISTLFLLSQTANSTELRHGVTFEAPDVASELNPCKLPSPSRGMLPITFYSDDEGLTLKFYLLDDKAFPSNEVLTSNLQKKLEKSYEKVELGSKDFSEYFDYVETGSFSPSGAGLATYFSKERNGWRLMLEAGFMGKEHKAMINRFLKTVEFQDAFGSVRSTNLDMSKWSDSASGFVPHCGDSGNPKIIFSQPLKYPAKAHLRGYETSVDVDLDIDEEGFVTDIRFNEDSWKDDYFKESVNHYLKNARFQVKLENGKPVIQKSLKNKYNFEIQASSRTRRR
ncbi:energy transducer TonB [Kangiella geojedonensis]|uniref:TonB C-terminal domain-containing protein n=1 Tax=Kangiella geojedonensis TaxID=914150 RepID=A0A0F6TPD4_9GAMM|nr:energy transducer TonB [Kangiella geojedonensis]AKE51414.1 hypothetical protein TQ33_0428 [Kangiella geojedonensis]